MCAFMWCARACMRARVCMAGVVWCCMYEYVSTHVHVYLLRRPWVLKLLITPTYHRRNTPLPPSLKPHGRWCLDISHTSVQIRTNIHNIWCQAVIYRVLIFVAFFNGSKLLHMRVGLDELVVGYYSPKRHVFHDCVECNTCYWVRCEQFSRPMMHTKCFNKQFTTARPLTAALEA